MLVSAELTNRLLKKACMADPSLATDGRRMAEMGRTALRRPEALATDAEDRALIVLGRALSCAQREIDDAEEEPESEALARLPRTSRLLRECLAVDPHCYDARTMLALAQSDGVEDALSRLEALLPEARAWCEERSRVVDGELSDAWDGVFLRPWLRMEGKVIEMLVTAACYRPALAKCRALLAASPADGQGVRHTAALLLARLEDEAGLDELDSAYGRCGSTWMHLSRAMLLYKLGRLDAARRALTGLATLCPGAAFYLAFPSYVQPYLPDRPPFRPGSDQESLLATYEADFLVVDTPDFVTWAQGVPAFERAAKDFGRAHGETV